MKIGDILINEAKVSTAAEDIDWVYNKVKSSGNKLEFMLKRIIGNWFTEIHSKLGASSAGHNNMNDLSALITASHLYTVSKNDNDNETVELAKKAYKDTIKKIKSKFNMKEETASEMLERQKGFPYQLKKVDSKYYIYNLGRKGRAYHKGVKELSELKEIVRPWLASKTLTYKEWDETIKDRLVRRYVDKLKDNFNEPR